MNSDIVNYYNEVKDDYPDVTLKQFGEICNSPFSIVKEVISNNVRDIRLQYFGAFKVSIPRINKIKKRLERAYEKKSINKEFYSKELEKYKEYEELQNNIKKH